MDCLRGIGRGGIDERRQGLALRELRLCRLKPLASYEVEGRREHLRELRQAIPRRDEQGSKAALAVSFAHWQCVLEKLAVTANVWLATGRESRTPLDLAVRAMTARIRTRRPPAQPRACVRLGAVF